MYWLGKFFDFDVGNCEVSNDTTKFTFDIDGALIILEYTNRHNRVFIQHNRGNVRIRVVFIALGKADTSSTAYKVLSVRVQTDIYLYSRGMSHYIDFNGKTIWFTVGETPIITMDNIRWADKIVHIPTAISTLKFSIDLIDRYKSFAIINGVIRIYYMDEI